MGNFKSYKELSDARVREAFGYDEETGKVFWKIRPLSHFVDAKSRNQWNGRYANTEAGTLHVSKKSLATYRMIGFDGCRILAHILVWFIKTGAWPEKSIDHVDGNGLNNRFYNLREVGQDVQLRNRPRRKDNTSGITGVTLMSNGQWKIRINIDGTEATVGYASDLSKAREMRLEAERQHGYTTELKGDE